MGFSLYDLFKATLLVLNAFAILHPQRFLRSHGLERLEDGRGAGVKQQLAGLLHAARFMRVPLIGFNLVIILVELIFG